MAKQKGKGEGLCSGECGWKGAAQGAASMAGDVECASPSACPALVARSGVRRALMGQRRRSETVRRRQGQRHGLDREARQQRCRARSSAPALGQRRAGAWQRLFVIASSLFSCGMWCPGVRHQTVAQRWCSSGRRQRAALPCSRVQGTKEEREGREKEGAGQHGFDCV